jgi:hypothetical protein
LDPLADSAFAVLSLRLQGLSKLGVIKVSAGKHEQSQRNAVRRSRPWNFGSLHFEKPLLKPPLKAFRKAIA